MLIGIVRSPHEVELPNFPSFESSHSWTTSDAKAGPNLGLLFSVNAQRVMRCRGTLIVPLGARLVGAHSGVDHYSPAV
jgi:hypothetical protein